MSNKHHIMTLPFRQTSNSKFHLLESVTFHLDVCTSIWLHGNFIPNIGCHYFRAGPSLQENNRRNVPHYFSGKWDSCLYQQAAVQDKLSTEEIPSSESPTLAPITQELVHVLKTANKTILKDCFCNGKWMESALRQGGDMKWTFCEILYELQWHGLVLNVEISCQANDTLARHVLAICKISTREWLRVEVLKIPSRRFDK